MTSFRLRLARGLDHAGLYERFVGSLPFGRDEDRSRVMIAGSELLDNVFSHSGTLVGDSVLVVICLDRSGSTLTLRFRGSLFRAFARGGGSGYMAWFDESERRYRGLGMMMAKNLADTVRYRSGLFQDTVSAFFGVPHIDA